MNGSQADYEALSRAWAHFLRMDAIFDDTFVPQAAWLADRAFLRAVEAAKACDPMALRAPSITDWITNRLRTYRHFARNDR